MSVSVIHAKGHQALGIRIAGNQVRKVHIASSCPRAERWQTSPVPSWLRSGSGSRVGTESGGPHPGCAGGAERPLPVSPVSR